MGNLTSAEVPSIRRIKGKSERRWQHGVIGLDTPLAGYQAMKSRVLLCLFVLCVALSGVWASESRFAEAAHWRNQVGEKFHNENPLLPHVFYRLRSVLFNLDADDAPLDVRNAGKVEIDSIRALGKKLGARMRDTGAAVHTTEQGALFDSIHNLAISQAHHTIHELILIRAAAAAKLDSTEGVEVTHLNAAEAADRALLRAAGAREETVLRRTKHGDLPAVERAGEKKLKSAERADELALAQAEADAEHRLTAAEKKDESVLKHAQAGACRTCFVHLIATSHSDDATAD